MFLRWCDQVQSEGNRSQSLVPRILFISFAGLPSGPLGSGARRPQLLQASHTSQVLTRPREWGRAVSSRPPQWGIQPLSDLSLFGCWRLGTDDTVHVAREGNAATPQQVMSYHQYLILNMKRSLYNTAFWLVIYHSYTLCRLCVRVRVCVRVLAIKTVSISLLLKCQAHLKRFCSFLISLWKLIQPFSEVSDV